MDMLKLRRLLDADALGRGYAKLDDAASADALNAPDQTRVRPLSSAELLAWSAGNGRFVKLRRAGDGVAPYDGLPIEVQSVAAAAYLMIARENTVLDLSLPDRRQMLGALVAAGVITQADADSLAALAREPASEAELAALGTVTPGDVQQARGLSLPEGA